MNKELFIEVADKMKKVTAILKEEYATIRAGRASSALLDKVYVDYYGTPTPVNQVASVSVPEPRMILIQPWDIKMIGSIEKAILKSDLGLNPNNDGKVIRLIIPELTAERRQGLVKAASKKAEESRVSVRNIRREYNDVIKKMEKNREISEDEQKRYQDEVQKLTDKYVGEIDKILEIKEKDIMEV
jgi:ribosome recycling factor